MVKLRQEKFLVDRMYQRISRWLRILGYDTVVDTDLSDDEYLIKAKKEKRIFLTRNENLIRKGQKEGIIAVSIDAPTLEERLAKLAKKTGIDITLDEKILPRCTICNGQLQDVPKAAIEEKLLPGTKENYENFWICMNKECQQIYWKGPHWVKMVKTIEISQELLKKEFD